MPPAAKPKRPRASRGAMGRPLDDPQAGPRHQHTITVTDAEWNALRRLGGGNASAGITRLLTWWTRRRRGPDH